MLTLCFAKGDYGRGEGFLQPIERRPVPFDTVHIDHLGPFRRSVNKNSYLLVLVDGFTKFVVAKPTRTLETKEMVAKLKEIFGEFGYPRRIISDRGLAFTSQEFGRFVAEKGIRHVQNAIATPRANGQVERVNRSVIGALATSAETEARWDETLLDIVWGLNNTINASTRFSPVELVFVHSSRGVVADLGVGVGELASARGPADSPLGSPSGNPAQGALADGVKGAKGREEGRGGKERPSGTRERQGDDLAHASTRSRQLLRRREMAKENIRRSAKRMKATYDRKGRPPIKYKVGELVLWRQAATNMGDKGVNCKLANKFDGPFKIAKVMEKDRYLIESVKGVRGYKRFKARVVEDALRRYPGTYEIDDCLNDCESD